MIKIMADSTCDLPEELIEKYDLGIAPLKITIEGKTYEDRVDIQPNDFYKIMEELDEYPTTSMPAPTKYIDIIEEGIEKGYDEFLCICMSSGTSGSYQSAEIAKKKYMSENPDTNIKIHVVDSTSMSHGSGWLIIKTCQLKEKGATFEELVEFNETYKRNVKHFLSVDDLDHLIKSGRLSNASAIIGKLLKIKPIMTMKDGKGAITSKERGRKKVLKRFVDEFNIRNNKDLTNFIIIGYTSDKIYAENLENTVRKNTDFKGDIYIMQMGVAVGTHVGLGGLSMYFMEKNKIKDNILVNEVREMKDARDALLKKIKNYTNK
jgi:DegV family protein with EDD domain